MFFIQRNAEALRVAHDQTEGIALLIELGACEVDAHRAAKIMEGDEKMLALLRSLGRKAPEKLEIRGKRFEHLVIHAV